jgi:hypothetical protein
MQLFHTDYVLVKARVWDSSYTDMIAIVVSEALPVI